MKIKGDITVENVHFTYPSRPDVPILRGMNLRVNAGQTVALVGSSGCGKSTIISLLLRYYDVLKGKITIDGVDVRDINLEFLRKNVAVVSQEPALFNCTIEENISVSIFLEKRVLKKNSQLQNFLKNNFKKLFRSEILACCYAPTVLDSQ